MLPTLTVDVGTTSVKLGLLDEDGAPRAFGRAATPTRADAWGEIYDAPALTVLIADFVRSLDTVDRASIRRVAIAGVGESGGLVREDLSLASPLILWHDQRGAGLLADLSPAERSRVYRVTGLPVSGNYALSKIAWALHHTAQAGGALWLNVAEYLAAWFTGRRRSEFSLASRTMALDLAARRWSPEICQLLDVGPEILPPLRHAVEGDEVRVEVASGLGLSREVRVHVAGHDHMVGGVGVELRRGELLNSTGTTEGLLALHDAPRLDAAMESTKLANGVAVTGADFTLFASLPTGGSAFATLQGLLGLDGAGLTDRIASVHERYLAGRVDLGRVPVVLPWFRGSPPPAKRSTDRGAIAGIGVDTTLDDVVLGCFLGMAVQFADVLDLFQEQPDRIKVIGPASGNPLWLQLKADLLGVSLSVSGVDEVVSRGAQAVASGVSGSWAACRPTERVPSAERYERLVEWRSSTDAVRSWLADQLL